MSRTSRTERLRRAPRVKLGGTVLALVQLQSGRQIQARLHQLSFTGGLLQLEQPLDEAIKVEVAFHVSNCTVRSKAVMLFPMWATQGCLQPFEFTDLQENDREKLRQDLQQFLDSCPVAAGSPDAETSSDAETSRDNDQAMEAASGSSE